MSEKRYYHRIEIPATICFDMESDNEEPTDEEVNVAVRELMDDEFGFTSFQDGDPVRAYPDLDWKNHPNAEIPPVVEYTINDTSDNPTYQLEAKGEL